MNTMHCNECGLVRHDYPKTCQHVMPTCDQCGLTWRNWPKLCDHCHPGFYAEVTIRSSKVAQSTIPETRLMGC